MASRISRRARCNSASLPRMILYRAMGIAAEERIRRIALAIISSRRVMPVSRPVFARVNRRIERKICTGTSLFVRLLLDRDRCLAGDQRYGLLLGVSRVDLHNLMRACARRSVADGHADQRTLPVHPRDDM